MVARKQMADITAVLTGAGAELPSAATVAGFDADEVATLTPEEPEEPEEPSVPVEVAADTEAPDEDMPDEDMPDEEVPDEEAPEDESPATNERSTWAALAAEYARAAELLREVVHNAEPAES